MAPYTQSKHFLLLFLWFWILRLVPEAVMCCLSGWWAVKHKSLFSSSAHIYCSVFTFIYIWWSVKMLPDHQLVTDWLLIVETWMYEMRSQAPKLSAFFFFFLFRMCLMRFHLFLDPYWSYFVQKYQPVIMVSSLWSITLAVFNELKCLCVPPVSSSERSCSANNKFFFITMGCSYHGNFLSLCWSVCECTQWGVIRSGWYPPPSSTYTCCITCSHTL